MVMLKRHSLHWVREFRKTPPGAHEGPLLSYLYPHGLARLQETSTHPGIASRRDGRGSSGASSAPYSDPKEPASRNYASYEVKTRSLNYYYGGAVAGAARRSLHSWFPCRLPQRRAYEVWAVKSSYRLYVLVVKQIMMHFGDRERGPTK